MPEFKLPTWSARNPLGIVALFISLIYGMSALLLGASVHSLLPYNQTILVVFIAIFPFVVLVVFGWLVAFHHTKLYGPADYRTDKGFLDSFRNAPAKDVGARLQQEVESSGEIKGILDLASEAVGKSEKGTNPAQIRLAAGVGRSWQLSRAYLIEGLLFQVLQDELGGAVRREVLMPGGAHVDGVIEGTDGSTTVVEIKLVSEPRSFANKIRDANNQLVFVQQTISAQGLKNFRFLLAIVVDGNLETIAKITKEANKLKPDLISNVEIKVYSVRDLLSRYGFPLEVFEANQVD